MLELILIPLIVYFGLLGTIAICAMLNAVFDLIFSPEKQEKNTDPKCDSRYVADEYKC